MIWGRIAEGGLDALVAASGSINPGDVSAVARLRKTWSGDEVRAALQLAEGRRRLAGKVEDAAAWLADPDGAQMATDMLVARHKARRFHSRTGRVLDLCSGIGADAKELAVVRPDVSCIELDPARALMCRHNTQREVTEADAVGVDVSGALVHIDPARRGGGKRVWRIEDIVPGPEHIGRLALASEGAAVKLMPGVDREDIEQAMCGGAGDVGEIEYISLRGRMTQAVWWTGGLSDGRGGTVATMITDGGIESIRGEPDDLPGWSELGEVLYAVDPAPERAGLLGVLADELSLQVLHPKLGVLTGGAHVVESPWVRGYWVLDRLAYREDRVRDSVRSLGGGIVAVKTRGGAIDPDRAQRALRGTGDRAITVFVLRFGERVEAIITERLARPAAG